MALINTIREKSGVAVGAVAVGMLLFIVGGDLIGGKNRLFNRNTNVVGTVNGDKIELPEFTAALEQAKQSFAQQQGRPPDEQTMGYLRDQVWNQLLYKHTYQPEIQKLGGLGVSDAELVDMVQGDNPSPAIKQAFTDPKTGQFDKGRLVEYLRNLDKQPPEAQAAYRSFEAGLREFERPVAKYNALLTSSVYVTTAEIKAFDAAQNGKGSFRYMFLPYTSVSDSTVKPTDEQLRDYLERHRAKYKVEDGRTVEYIVVAEKPSAQDSAEVRKTLADLTEKFRAAPADSLFVRANSDQPYSGAYVPVAQLPAPLAKTTPLTVGQVYGPFVGNGALTLYKLTGQQPLPKVRASHILFKVEKGATPEAKAAAKKQAEEVLAKIKAGADFAAMAKQYGSDGTKDKGGDLDFFDRKSMVPEFSKAAFGAPGLGLVPTLVETSFGYHIIKVTGKKSEETYRVAAVAKAIQPSQATTDAAYNRAEQLADEAKSLAAFRALTAKDKTLQKQEAKFIARDAPALGSIPNSREIVRWAFGLGAEGETKLGDVRKFDIGDQHVIAALTDTRSKGTATVESIRPELTAAVRNELKAKQIIARLQGKTGTLEQLAQAAGAGAVVQNAENVTQGQANVPGVGLEPDAVGRAFALKPGQRSAPIQGEQGVLVVEGAGVVANTVAPDIKALRQQLTQQRQQRQGGQVFQALKGHANVEDNRARFF